MIMGQRGRYLAKTTHDHDPRLGWALDRDGGVGLDSNRKLSYLNKEACNRGWIANGGRLTEGIRA
jgi:hypothetical protein